MKGRTFTAAGLLAVVAAGGAALFAGWPFVQKPAPIPDVQVALLPDDQMLVAKGEAVYRESCAACHGVNLEGQTPDWRSPGPDGRLPAPPHDETGHTWHHADTLLFQLTKYGVARVANLENYDSGMPAYEGVLTDNEIVAVLSYIKSIWPADVRERHDRLNQQAKASQDQ
jgi:mono/diheme cytochrome c family protein